MRRHGDFPLGKDQKQRRTCPQPQQEMSRGQKVHINKPEKSAARRGRRRRGGLRVATYWVAIQKAGVNMRKPNKSDSGGEMIPLVESDTRCFCGGLILVRLDSVLIFDQSTQQNGQNHDVPPARKPFGWYTTLNNPPPRSVLAQNGGRKNEI